MTIEETLEHYNKFHSSEDISEETLCKQNEIKFNNNIENDKDMEVLETLSKLVNIKEILIDSYCEIHNLDYISKLKSFIENGTELKYKGENKGGFLNLDIQYGINNTSIMENEYKEINLKITFLEYLNLLEDPKKYFTSNPIDEFEILGDSALDDMDYNLRSYIDEDDVDEDGNDQLDREGIYIDIKSIHYTQAKDTSDILINDFNLNESDVKKNIVGFETARFTLVEVSNAIDDEQELPPAYMLANESLDKFINELKTRFDGIIEDNIQIEIDNTLQEYHSGIINDKIKDLESMNAYITITKALSNDAINAIFLDLSDYDFYAIFENYETNDVITQQYYYGEFQSGYFFDNGRYKEYHTNEFKSFSCYQQVQKTL